MTKNYFESHPYSKLYSLPKDLRPTGAGFSYASIDHYPDPNLGHPDKVEIKTNTPAGSSWLTPHKYSHGMFVSTLAVGEQYGLASDSKLHIIQTLDDMPIASLAAAIHTAVTLKENDPSLMVVGLSIGVAFPVEFASLIPQSPVYQSMAKDLTKLHEMGVVVAISAGNNPNEGRINILGLLPYTTIIGAIYSAGTVTTEDDTISRYTTYKDGDGRIDFYAHADPVLSYSDRETLTWTREGGTSAAQPHFAASLLVLKSVNPKLNADQCLEILKKTTSILKIPQGDEAWASQHVDLNLDLAINPILAVVVAAHLPGSTYKDKRLEDLTQQLIGTSSAEFQKTAEFLEIAKLFLVK